MSPKSAFKVFSILILCPLFHLLNKNFRKNIFLPCRSRRFFLSERSCVRFFYYNREILKFLFYIRRFFCANLFRVRLNVDWARESIFCSSTEVEFSVRGLLLWQCSAFLFGCFVVVFVSSSFTPREMFASRVALCYAESSFSFDLNGHVYVHILITGIFQQAPRLALTVASSF